MKKVIFAFILLLILVLTFSNISFAQNDNTTTTLSNEVTESMNKTERNMNDLVDRTELDKAGSRIENGARSVGNTLRNGMNNVEKGVESFVDGNNDSNDNRVENRSVAGRTGNFTAGQVQTDGDTTTSTGPFSQTTWIWIVMIVSALVIIAAVWYYATQRD